MNWLDFFNSLAVTTKNKVCQNGAMFTIDKKIHQKTFNDINKKMQFAKDDIVLDIGCGNGEITKFIVPLVKKVILIDGASKMLELAQQATKNFKNTEFKLLNLNKAFDFSALGSLDKILCYSVVHYLDDYQKFENLLREMIKVLKPGGRILVGDIPLADKGKEYLKERRKKPLLNFFSNLKYFFKKFITSFMIAKVNRQLHLRSNIYFNRDKIMLTISNLKAKDLNLSLMEQERGLPFSNSREDLLIIKNEIIKIYGNRHSNSR